MWLGRADPVATVAALAVTDPVRERRGEVFAAIAKAFPDRAKSFNVKDLIAKTCWPNAADVELSAALESVAKDKHDETIISNKSLGWWLRRNANRISGGFKLERDSEGREGQWLLTPVKAASEGFFGF
jgi:hypothetical protein